jgi:uncharacterized peroxidase-related enzyme
MEGPIMSRIPIPTLEQAPSGSKSMLAKLGNQLGTVPNLYRIVATSPSALEAVLNFHTALSKGALDTLIGERIALAVAEANNCDYCLSAQIHRVRKGAMLDDAEITANRNGASNDIKADVAVRFAAKLTRERGKVGDADILAVQGAGYSNAEIVEIVAHVAFNSFTNTITTALKTDIDFPKVGARNPG